MTVKQLRLIIATIFLFNNLGYSYGEMNNPGIGRRKEMHISIAAEMRIGRNLHKQILQQYKISQNRDLVQRVNSIGKKIVAIVERKDIIYNFYVIMADGYNAFSIPGGNVYVFSDLLPELNDDELAYIMAYAVANIDSGYAAQRMVDRVTQRGEEDRSTTGNERLDRMLFEHAMAEESIKEALYFDILALEYAYKAGYSPMAAITLLEKFKKRQLGKLSKKDSWEKTNTYYDQRIENIKKVTGNLIN